MAEQALDVRGAIAVLRRHRVIIALGALLGAVLGGLLAVSRPTMYTSTTEVLLPTHVTSSTEIPSATAATQIRIASSEAVLGPAGRAAAPTLSLAQLTKRIAVSAPSEQTISFAVSAPTAARARSLARAVAASELDYIARASARQTDTRILTLLNRIDAAVGALAQRVDASPASSTPKVAALSSELATLSGQLQALTAAAQPTTGVATVIQPASAATRPGVVHSYGLLAGLGLVGGLLLSSAITLLVARRDRRLHSRDQLAAAVGCPVLTSFSGRGARSAGGWHQLLGTYAPPAVDAWALRQLLREVPTRPDGGREITVLSPEGDARAVELGALFASYAAGTGISTELVFHDLDVNPSLCSVLRRADGEELRPSLRVSHGATSGDAALTVVVTTATEDASSLTGPAVIAVTAGSATGERLARAAVVGEEAGTHLIGVVVVDPETDDRTSGRLFGRGGDEGYGANVPTRLPGLSTATGLKGEMS